MSDRFELDIELGYVVPKKYRALLKERELVNQDACSFLITVKNISGKRFPGTKARVEFIEHGFSIGAAGLTWRNPSDLIVPKIKSSEQVELEPFQFSCLTDGLTVLKIEFIEKPDMEIYVLRGDERLTRKEITFPFKVIKWQDLEILSMLKKWSKKK